ncbi:basic proline-rich protein-like [Strigops habroptila]|uniref:basic proline-rich protein-like n=1 Tax=Strigops habroptila TaxID=2489341 RepID=UPI0011CFF53A|nr:basic proline-rich protein-like [Strigops habroptila]
MPSPTPCANTAGDLASIPPSSRARLALGNRLLLPPHPTSRAPATVQGGCHHDLCSRSQPAGTRAPCPTSPPVSPPYPLTGGRGAPHTRGERPAAGRALPGRAAIPADPAGQCSPPSPPPPPAVHAGTCSPRPSLAAPRPTSLWTTAPVAPRGQPGPALRSPGQHTKFSTAHARWRPAPALPTAGNTPRGPALGTAGQPPPSSPPLPRQGWGGEARPRPTAAGQRPGGHKHRVPPPPRVRVPVPADRAHKEDRGDPSRETGGEKGKEAPPAPLTSSSAPGPEAVGAVGAADGAQAVCAGLCPVPSPPSPYPRRCGSSAGRDRELRWEPAVVRNARGGVRVPVSPPFLACRLSRRRPAAARALAPRTCSLAAQRQPSVQAPLRWSPQQGAVRAVERRGEENRQPRLLSPRPPPRHSRPRDTAEEGAAGPPLRRQRGRAQQGLPEPPQGGQQRAQRPPRRPGPAPRTPGHATSALLVAAHPCASAFSGGSPARP